MSTVVRSCATNVLTSAAIHGRPYESWDGVPPRDGIDSPGYCTHVSNLLLPWHRPYTVLLEQTLYSHIIEAVNEFPPGPIRQRMARAAVNVRWPYWDFAATPKNGGSVWPTIITKKFIQVLTPQGNRTVKNPLHSYDFHPVNVKDMFFDPVRLRENVLDPHVS